MIEAVIFDMDGVIVDTMPTHFKAYQIFLKEYGEYLSEEEWIEIAGNSTLENMKIFKENRCLDFDCENAARKKRNIANRIFDGKTVIFEGVKETLEELADYKMALVTSARREAVNYALGGKGFLKHRAFVFAQSPCFSSWVSKHKSRVLKNPNTPRASARGFLTYFQVIVSVDELDRPKPDPQGYRLAARKLGVREDNCLVIEDTAIGIKAAKNAGMYCAAVRNTLPGERLGSADYVVEDIREVGKIVEHINV